MIAARGRVLVWKEGLRCLILCLSRTLSSHTEASDVTLYHGPATAPDLSRQSIPASRSRFRFGRDSSPDELAQILTEEGATWKNVVYTPLLTTWAFLWQMLNPDRSCRAAVKRVAAWLSAQGKKLANDNDDPYIKAQQRLPEAVPFRLMKHIGRRCHEQGEAAWRWCGKKVKAVDGSTVSMADTDANQAAYPQSRSQAPGLGFPLARLVVVFCLGDRGRVGVGDRACQRQEDRREYLVSQPLGRSRGGRGDPGGSCVLFLFRYRAAEGSGRQRGVSSPPAKAAQISARSPPGERRPDRHLVSPWATGLDGQGYV